VILAALAGWVLHLQAANFTIHSRPRDDGGHQYRASGRFRAAPEAVAQVVLEPIKHGTLPGLLREDVIVNGPGERLVRDVWRFPIIQDRDTCLRVEIRRAEKRWRMKWSQVSGCPAPEDGVVRMAANEGYWELEPDAEGGTRFTTELYSDPGGWVPRWLSRALVPGHLEGLVPAIDRAACAVPGSGCEK
jgi:hypothetical protein